MVLRVSSSAIIGLFDRGRSAGMMTTGTLGAALSTAIWAAIAGAAWAGCTARLLGGQRLARVWTGLANLVGWTLIVLVPQGLRLWGPKDLIQRFLPHTLTVI